MLAPAADAPAVDLGSIGFANAPTSYTSTPIDAIQRLTVTGSGMTSTFDWLDLDLLSLKPRRTIYLAGTFPLLTTIACYDSNEAPHGPLPGDFPAFCTFHESQ